MPKKSPPPSARPTCSYRPIVERREHSGSSIEMLVGFDVSTLIPHTLRVPPWNTNPLLSGKNAGSNCVSIGICTLLRCRSTTYEPAALETPCATQRPSGELRVQYDE